MHCNYIILLSMACLTSLWPQTMHPMAESSSAPARAVQPMAGSSSTPVDDGSSLLFPTQSLQDIARLDALGSTSVGRHIRQYAMAWRDLDRTWQEIDRRYKPLTGQEPALVYRSSKDEIARTYGAGQRSKILSGASGHDEIAQPIAQAIGKLHTLVRDRKGILDDIRSNLKPFLGIAKYTEDQCTGMHDSFECFITGRKLAPEEQNLTRVISSFFFLQKERLRRARKNIEQVIQPKEGTETDQLVQELCSRTKGIETGSTMGKEAIASIIQTAEKLSDKLYGPNIIDRKQCIDRFINEAHLIMRDLELFCLIFDTPTADHEGPAASQRSQQRALALSDLESIENEFMRTMGSTIGMTAFRVGAKTALQAGMGNPTVKSMATGYIVPELAQKIPEGPTGRYLPMPTSGLLTRAAMKPLEFGWQLCKTGAQKVEGKYLGCGENYGKFIGVLHDMVEATCPDIHELLPHDETTPRQGASGTLDDRLTSFMIETQNPRFLLYDMAARTRMETGRFSLPIRYAIKTLGIVGSANSETKARCAHAISGLRGRYQEQPRLPLYLSLLQPCLTGTIAGAEALLKAANPSLTQDTPQLASTYDDVVKPSTTTISVPRPLESRLAALPGFTLVSPDPKPFPVLPLSDDGFNDIAQPRIVPAQALRPSLFSRLSHKIGTAYTRATRTIAQGFRFVANKLSPGGVASLEHGIKEGNPWSSRLRNAWERLRHFNRISPEPTIAANQLKSDLGAIAAAGFSQ